MTQSPPTPEEIELKKAQTKQALAEAELAEAKAEQELKQLNLPETESTGVDGSITIGEGTGYYAELLAIEALGQVAHYIDSRIPADVKKIVLTTEFDLREQQILWSVLNGRLADLNQQIDRYLEEHPADGSSVTIAKESPLSLLAAAPSVLGALTDVAKFFKTDRKIQNRSIQLSSNALLSSLAGRLINSGRSVILEQMGSSADSELIRSVGELINAREALLKRKADIRKSISSQLAELREARQRVAQLKLDIAKEKDARKKAELQDELKNAEFLAEQLRGPEDNISAVDAQFNELASTVSEAIESMTTQPKDGKSLVQAVATIDLFKAHSDAHILVVELSSQGGEVEVAQGGFLRSGRISYQGGVGISFSLLDTNFSVKAADVLWSAKHARFKGLGGNAIRN